MYTVAPLAAQIVVDLVVGLVSIDDTFANFTFSYASSSM